MSGRLFVVSAPSGAGKTSLVEASIPIIKKRYPIEQVITYTTKKPRNTDPSRKDFHFLEIDEFERLIQKQFFLEWSDAYGAYYGTPRSVVEELQKGESRVLVIDRAGAQQVIGQISDAVLIWITVARIEILKERLLKRATETPEQIAHRLVRAQIEMALEAKNQLYPYHILNDNFEMALNRLVAVMTKELA